MNPLIYPASYALFVWWFSTGIVLLLDNLCRRTFRWSLIAATILFAISLHRLWAGAADTSEAGVYATFTYAIIAWAWQEMSFFMGAVTGPRRTGAAPDATLAARFRQGFAASLWHEVAIAATVTLIVWSTWGAPNQVGTWTFLLLWLMRTSGKLNVVLGVLNLGEDFLPAHLRYHITFMARRPINPLMPISLTLGTVGTVLLGRAALAAPTLDQAAGLTFLTAILALAVVEHWFLILPLPFARLWACSLRFTPGHSKNKAAIRAAPLGRPSYGLPALLP